MMQVLTPSGYRDASTLAAGDEVCAFDAETGTPIVNDVEAVQSVDYAEWCRWWQVEETVPAFNWYRINGSFLLFGEQSIWRNGTNVCHAKHLTLGDEIYDDADQPVTIASVEIIEDNSLVWYRFDISGDHSYIVDGLTVHNASRFWVGGTGAWDSSTTTNWASSSGGAGGQSVPGAADAVTFDGSSGGGTVTVNYGGAITIQSLTISTFTGTWDNSANNNDFTISGSTGFVVSLAGVKTINIGAATFTLTSATAQWNLSTSTNVTFAGSSSSIVFTGPSTTSSCTFATGNRAYGSVTFGAASGGGFYSVTSSGATISTWNIAGPNYIRLVTVLSVTISNPFNWSGSKSALITIETDSVSLTATVNAGAGSMADWCSFRGVTFTGSPVATNSFDGGKTSGITITPPSGGGTVYPRAGLQAIGEGLSR